MPKIIAGAIAVLFISFVLHKVYKAGMRKVREQQLKNKNRKNKI